MRIVLDDPYERARLELLAHTSDLRNRAIETTRSEDGEEDARRGLAPATLVLADALSRTEWEPLARAAALLQQIARAVLVADVRGVLVPCCGVVEQMIDHCVEEPSPDPDRLADLLERLAALVPPLDLVAPEAGPEAEEPPAATEAAAEERGPEPIDTVAEQVEAALPRLESVLDTLAAHPFDTEALGTLGGELDSLRRAAERAGAPELAAYIEPGARFAAEVAFHVQAGEEPPIDGERLAGFLLRMVDSIHAMVLRAAGRAAEDHVPIADLEAAIAELRQPPASPQPPIPEAEVAGGEEAALDEELAEAFAEESAEIFQRCDELLQRLARDPSDPDVLHGLFRAFHTLKGAAASVGLHAIAAQFLPAEDLFEDMAEAVRSSGALPVDPSRLVDFAFRIVESGKGLADRARGRGDSPHAVLDDVQERVRAVRESKPPAAPEPAPAPPPAPQPPPEAQPPEATGEIGLDAELAEAFAEESAEIVARCRNLIPRLTAPGDVVPVLRDLFRAFHTLKGAAASVGLQEAADAFRDGEDLFEALYEETASSGRLALDPGALAAFTSRLLRSGCALAERAAGKPVRAEDIIDDVPGEIAKLRSRPPQPPPPAPPPPARASAPRRTPAPAAAGGPPPAARAAGGQQRPPIKTRPPAAPAPAPGDGDTAEGEPIRVTPRVGAPASRSRRRRRGSTTHRRRR